MMIYYNGIEIMVRGGAWLDIMNSCFYAVIAHIDRFDICIEYQSGELFALPSF